MKRNILIVLGTALMALSCAAPVFAVDQSHTDMWEYSNLSSATSSYLTLTSSITNLFGDTQWCNDGTGVVLFYDGAPKEGSIHWVNWETNDPVTIGSFSLFAAHDGSTQAPYGRAFKHFSLYAYDADNVQHTLYSQDIPLPNYSSTSPYNQLKLFDEVDEVLTASKFRAEFTQANNTMFARGPRLYELDGYSTTVTPEPASALLFSLGALSFLGFRKKSKRM